VLHSVWLGRVGYPQALEMQRRLVELRRQGRVGNTLLLLEHPPVVTLGRNATRANILAGAGLLERRGVAVFETNRGGEVTYHGPGQLIGYPIFDLRGCRPRLGPVDFVRRLEEALIRLCAGYGVRSGRVAGRTGVWTEPGGSLAERKLAALGIHVSRGITSHGFALNVTTDLRDFELIVPCGIADREVTSLEREMPAGAAPALAEVADAAARHLGRVFGEQVLARAGLEDLLQEAAAAPGDEGRGELRSGWSADLWPGLPAEGEAGGEAGAGGRAGGRAGDAAAAGPASLPPKGLDRPLEVPPCLRRIRGEADSSLA
jgi:lipoyl(octanoyl) transferase